MRGSCRTLLLAWRLRVLTATSRDMPHLCCPRDSESQMLADGKSKAEVAEELKKDGFNTALLDISPDGEPSS